MHWAVQTRSSRVSGDGETTQSQTMGVERLLPPLDLSHCKQGHSIPFQQAELGGFLSSRTQDRRKRIADYHNASKYNKTLQTVTQYMTASKDKPNLSQVSQKSVRGQFDTISRDTMSPQSKKMETPERGQPPLGRPRNFSGYFELDQARNDQTIRDERESREPQCFLPSPDNESANDHDVVDREEFYEELVDKFERALKGEDILAEQTRAIQKLEGKLRHLELKREMSDKERAILESIDRDSIESLNRNSRSSEEANLRQTMQMYSARLGRVHEQMDNTSQKRTQREGLERDIVHREQLAKRKALLCLIEEEKERMRELEKTVQAKCRVLDFQLRSETEKNTALKNNLEKLSKLGYLGNKESDEYKGPPSLPVDPPLPKQGCLTPSNKLTSSTNLLTRSAAESFAPRGHVFQFSHSAIDTGTGEVSTNALSSPLRGGLPVGASEGGLEGGLHPLIHPKITKIQSMGARKAGPRSKNTPTEGGGLELESVVRENERRVPALRISIPQLRLPPLSRSTIQDSLPLTDRARGGGQGQVYTRLEPLRPSTSSSLLPPPPHSPHPSNPILVNNPDQSNRGGRVQETPSLLPLPMDSTAGLGQGRGTGHPAQEIQEHTDSTNNRHPFMQVQIPSVSSQGVERMKPPSLIPQESTERPAPSQTRPVPQPPCRGPEGVLEEEFYKELESLDMQRHSGSSSSSHEFFLQMED